MIYQTDKARIAQKELYKRLKKKIPKWKKEGSRDEYIKNMWMIIQWNRSFYYSHINKRDNFTCQDCNIDLLNNNLEYETHHIIPRSKGGSEHPKNLKTLCKICHRKYTNHLLKNKSAYDKEQRNLRGMIK